MSKLRSEVGKEMLSGATTCHTRHKVLGDIGDLESMEDELPAVP